MLEILVDADACPVKEEVYRVAKRYSVLGSNTPPLAASPMVSRAYDTPMLASGRVIGLKVTLVANSQMRIPGEDWLKQVIVSNQFDAADDWIADHASKNDIVISGDIPLASRCLKKGARVLGPNGRAFTENSIGEALATRDLMYHLRDIGIMTGGPPPFDKKDRSRFLQSLDGIIQAIRNGK